MPQFDEAEAAALDTIADQLEAEAATLRAQARDIRARAETRQSRAERLQRVPDAVAAYRAMNLPEREAHEAAARDFALDASTVARLCKLRERQERRNRLWERNRAILHLASMGWKNRHIAERFGLSEPSISRILQSTLRDWQPRWIDHGRLTAPPGPSDL